MKRTMTRHLHAAVRALILMCVLVSLVAATLTTSPAQSAAFGPLQQAEATPVSAAVQAQSTLSVGSTAQSSAGTGSLVYNGEPITYTFTITNIGATAATNLKVYDSLPADTLDQIACFPECGRVGSPRRSPPASGDEPDQDRHDYRTGRQSGQVPAG